MIDFLKSSVLTMAMSAAALVPAAAQDIERFPAANPAAPYSAAVAYGDTLYLAGVLGRDLETGELGDGVQEQTDLALGAMKSALADAGSDESRVLNCTVFLADMNDYAAMNDVFAAFFADAKPARTTIQAQPPIGAAVEISCIAALPAPTSETE